MQFAYGYGGAASPLVQKHLAASPYLPRLDLFLSHYLFPSLFDASRRLSRVHSRLVVWPVTGLSYFRIPGQFLGTFCWTLCYTLFSGI